MPQDFHARKTTIETSSTAVNGYRSYSYEEDQLIMASVDDLALAKKLERTYNAIEVRRHIIRKALAQGYTLDTMPRYHRVASTKTHTHVEEPFDPTKVCPECFCYPHSAGCVNE